MRAIENFNRKKITIEEFIILDYLKSSGKSVSFSRLSSAVDKSAVSVKKMISKLKKIGMVKFDIEVSEKFRADYYSITDKGNSFVKQINEKIEEKA